MKTTDNPAFSLSHGVSHGSVLSSDTSVADAAMRILQERLAVAARLHDLSHAWAGIAHDVNNLLGVIVGRLHLLSSDKTLSVDTRKHLQIIEQATNDAGLLLRRSLQFQKKSNEHETTESIDDGKRVNVLEVLQDVMQLASTKAGQHIQISIQKLGTPSPTWVYSKAYELREVFLNLVNNAIDAMPQGGNIKITVDEEFMVSDQGDPRLYYEIVVEDTGTGIPAEILSHIFEPFVTTKGEKGTGLGLSVCRDIVRRWGGNMWVSSVVAPASNHGTRMCVRLPILLDEEKADNAQIKSTETPTTTHPATHPATQQQQTGKARILVVEDDAAVRQLLADILSMQDYDVVMVSNAEDARALLHREVFSAVVTDLNLPTASGLDLANHIRHDDHIQIPICLLTGWSADIDEKTLQYAGIQRILQKPFDVHTLGAVLQELLTA